jgi:hypothetical protein
MNLRTFLHLPSTNILFDQYSQLHQILSRLGACDPSPRNFLFPSRSLLIPTLSRRTCPRSRSFTPTTSLRARHTTHQYDAETFSRLTTASCRPSRVGFRTLLSRNRSTTEEYYGGAARKVCHQGYVTGVDSSGVFVVNKPAANQMNAQQHPW